MIKLDVSSYCQNCPYFKVDVTNPTKLYSNYGSEYYGDTIIRCENADRCRYAVMEELHNGREI